MKDNFLVTPENLIENIKKIGPWSIYGLAIEALQYYFPNEYNEDGYCSAIRESELLGEMGCNYWQDVVIKYQNEIGYKAPNGFNIEAVNEN